MDWDLSSYFSKFDGPTYAAFKTDLKGSIGTLDVKCSRILLDMDFGPKIWASIIIDYEQILTKVSHLRSYISCLISAEASNEAYQKEESSFAGIQAEITKLSDKIMRGIGMMDDETFNLMIKQGRLKDATYPLAELRERAKNRMSGELEELAADLGVDGIGAWSRLYFTSMGNMKFYYMDPESGETKVPMAQLNSLLSNPNRERRIAALDGAAKAFKEHQHTYAAALNSMSGTRHTLNKRRGITSFLETSLTQSRISQTTLDALMTAVDNRLPFAREVFKFRNSCMNISDPGYADLRAPLPLGNDTGPAWEDGVALISIAFNSIYPALGSFFDELIKKKWVDYTPRDNKRPGGFCTGSLITRESRIFMTYKDTLNDVLTLAHEAGHAWHSRLLKNTRPLTASYPMTIAESASTFAERILTQGVLSSDAYDDSVKLVLLDAEIEHMLAFLLDLPVRYRFENALYERRKSGSLAPAELCELMRDTQREVFGDSIFPGREDPWFWASKLHFYIEGVQFYNYPYTFGYLLSTAYVRRLRDGADGALNAYEQFLTDSGKKSCEQLVMDTIGEDIGDPGFWAELIDGLQEPFDLYKQMLSNQSN